MDPHLVAPRLKIPSSALRRVAGSFGKATFERGLAYAQEGRVELVHPEWPVVAKVRGTEGYVVTVYGRGDTVALSGECTCPVEIDCKHAAAAALVALSDDRERQAALQGAKQERAVAEWLAGFAVAAATPGPVDDRAARHIVAYVIERSALRGPTGGEGELLLTVHKTSALKRGGFSKSTVMSSLGDPYRGAPHWVPTDDMRRIALVRAMAGASPHDVRLSIGSLDAEMFCDLAQSGHLFFGQVEGAPLTYGPPRTAALTWREEDGAGSAWHTLGLDSDLLLVAAADCLYIDPMTRTIGPLDLGLSPSLVRTLVAGPPVPSGMLETVRASLRALLANAPEAGLEALVGDSLLATTGEGEAPLAPRPHLEVGLEESPWDDVRQMFVTPFALYGEERFALAEWEPRRTTVRDLVAEGRLRARLDELADQAERRVGGGRSAVLKLYRYVAEVVVPTLRAEGWTCEVAADFPFSPPAVVEQWVEDVRPMGSDNSWFAIEMGVVIGGKTVSLLPILLEAIERGEIPLDGTLSDGDVLAGMNLRLEGGDLVHVPGDRLKRWLRPLIELSLRGLNRERELLVPSFTAVTLEPELPGRFTSGDALAVARDLAQRLLTLEPDIEPESFGGTLRPYQRRGLSWLSVLHDAGFGGLLADEMGLGKTVQVLAFFDALFAKTALTAQRPALVVAPRSVVGHWHREASRFSPALDAAIHLGIPRARSSQELLGPALIITSYQTLLRDLELFAKIEWTTVVFDESQALKNPDTRLRKGMRKLRAASKFCITGTPVENHLRELWSQMDLVMPGLLGGKTAFGNAFRRPIEKYANNEALEFLRQRIRPFLLRRTKDVVAPDLPDKTDIVERVELGPEQRDLYESLRLSLDADVRRALRDKGVQGSSFAILDALLKLRQCCCHPQLIKTEQAQEVARSAKLERLISMLEELCDSGKRVLVFSQFTSMLDIIERECQAAGLGYLKLTGSTRNRDKVVTAFQAGEAPIFLISLKAGGTGLNLTRADTVIHYDPWWNPAAEDQATDRAHRIGQDKNVFVYRLVASGTLEERIAEMQDGKRTLTSATLARGGVTHLGAGDLAALYRQIV